MATEGPLLRAPAGHLPVTTTTAGEEDKRKGETNGREADPIGR